MALSRAICQRMFHNVIKVAFYCRPGAIAMSLVLREPKYHETVAYCHFRREADTKSGLSSDVVNAELKDNNYLTKWVV